ncbi:MAG: glycosyltransferase family 39 protein [Chloroflexota bacterium]|nr:glycosyltransferase family 39 protein [Chloroflexota bacterium]
MNTRTRRTPIAAVIVHCSLYSLFIALAVAYSLASPLYEPTDELRHFRYVRHLIVYRSLPVQRADVPRAQSHHPPLYYALGALASGWVPVEQEVYYEPPINPYWAYRYWEVSDDNKNQYLHSGDVGQLGQLPHLHGVVLAAYVVRWMTVLIGAGVVWLTYRIGREILPDQPALAIGGAALVAFNPQFVYLSGAVNNDIPAALCSAAVLLVCIRLVRDGPSVRTDVTLGILYGLALLTKFHLLALLVPIALAYLIAARPPRTHTPILPHPHTPDWRAFLRGILTILGLAALISGWWFWRNQVLYGDPTGMSKVNELWAGRPAGGNWWAILQNLPYLWSSLWGRFGYGQVPLPQIIYQGALVFCLLALAGYLLPRRDPLPRAPMLLLATVSLIFAAVVSYYILIQPAGAMGRFLFPGLPAFAFLLCLGLSRFLPRRLTWVAGLIVTVGMAALALYALVGVLAPAFARPHPLTETEIEAVPNPTSVEFGDAGFPSYGEDQRGVARLLGYRVTPTTVEPGDVVNVTLYWQTLARPNQNYAVFVHLLSEVGTMVAQRDTYHGLGSYPTTAWEPGVAFADTYRLHIPETAYAPDRGHIQIGMYQPDGPRLTIPDGRDALRLATVDISPRSSPLEGGLRGVNPLNVNFGDQAALAGYTLDRRVVQPGETIRLTLYWRALAPMETNYSVFAHVLGVKDQVWAGNDGWPAGGNAPTGLWKPGQVIEDVRDLAVGLTTPPDFYDIEVGLYGSGGNRLPVVAEDGRWLDSRVLLSKIRVVDE